MFAYRARLDGGTETGIVTSVCFLDEMLKIDIAREGIDGSSVHLP